MSEEVDPRFDNQEAKATALNHVRAMHLWAADLRVKNFNFFIVLVGILVAAIVNMPDHDKLWLVLVAGLILGPLFLIVDVRTYRLIKDARADEYQLEPLFGISLHTVDKIADASRAISRSNRTRLLSHTLAYRTTFILVTILCAIQLLMLQM